MLLHCLLITVGEESKKRGSISKRQHQIRQAKAYVISVLGEFASTCQSKQVCLYMCVYIKILFGMRSFLVSKTVGLSHTGYKIAQVKTFELTFQGGKDSIALNSDVKVRS